MLVLLWFVQGSLFPLTAYVSLFVLLVSSLYRKLVLLFLIYILLTFDQKKKKKELSVRENLERDALLLHGDDSTVRLVRQRG
jgi:hypothetical protein